ncbi:MAG: hypothetical protein ACJ77Z_20570, partial [Thermoleophilaceae bacterium]
MRVRRALACVLSLLALGLIGPAASLAHVERASYWPDPAPDTSIKPAAGGAVPKARSLASALDAKAPGDTRVVCQHDSLDQLKQSVARARKSGYNIRPSDHRSLSKKQAAALIKVNTALLKL